MLEAIEVCEAITGRTLKWEYQEDNRIGDHIWWISDVSKFQAHYPQWRYHYDLRGILEEIHDAGRDTRTTTMHVSDGQAATERYL
jgi:CDP-paratose 2-epimerase